METLKINTIKSETNESLLTAAPPVMLSQIIHASVEDVFDAWKEVEKMKQWCAPEGIIESDFRVGGRFILEWKNKGVEIVCSGTYEEIFPYRLIRSNLLIADKTSTVSVRFRPIGKVKTELLLNHQGIPESGQEDYRAYWTSSLNKLKTLLEKH